MLVRGLHFPQLSTRYAPYLHRLIKHQSFRITGQSHLKADDQGRTLTYLMCLPSVCIGMTYLVTKSCTEMTNSKISMRGHSCRLCFLALNYARISPLTGNPFHIPEQCELGGSCCQNLEPGGGPLLPDVRPINHWLGFNSYMHCAISLS